MANVNQHKKTIKKLVKQRDELRAQLDSFKAVTVALQHEVTAKEEDAATARRLLGASVAEARAERDVLKLRADKLEAEIAEIRASMDGVMKTAGDYVTAAKDLYAQAEQDRDVKKLRRRLKERTEELDAMTTVTKGITRRLHTVVRTAVAGGVSLEEIKAAVQASDGARIAAAPLAPAPQL